MPERLGRSLKVSVAQIHLTEIGPARRVPGITLHCLFKRSHGLGHISGLGERQRNEIKDLRIVWVFLKYQFKALDRTFVIALPLHGERLLELGLKGGFSAYAGPSHYPFNTPHKYNRHGG